MFATRMLEIKNRLYEFNKDRDNSMKRYLREDPDYGKSIQIFIKTWIDWNEDASFEEFCQHVINTTSNNGWVKYFKQRSNIIWEAWRKRIFEEMGISSLLSRRRPIVIVMTQC